MWWNSNHIKKRNGEKSCKRGGDSCSAYDGCLLVDRWKDNKVVTIVSNCIPKNEHGSTKRCNRKEHKVVTVSIPKSIETYNAIMGYVDLMDIRIQLATDLRSEARHNGGLSFPGCSECLPPTQGCCGRKLATKIPS